MVVPARPVIGSGPHADGSPCDPGSPTDDHRDGHANPDDHPRGKDEPGVVLTGGGLRSLRRRESRPPTWWTELGDPGFSMDAIAMATWCIRTTTLRATTGAVLTRAELPILTRTRTTRSRGTVVCHPALPRTVIATATRIRTTTLRATTGAVLLSRAGNSLRSRLSHGRSSRRPRESGRSPSGRPPVRAWRDVRDLGAAGACWSRRRGGGAGTRRSCGPRDGVRSGPGVIGTRSPAPHRWTTDGSTASSIARRAAGRSGSCRRGRGRPCCCCPQPLGPVRLVVSRYAVFVQKPKRPTTVDPLVMR